VGEENWIPAFAGMTRTVITGFRVTHGMDVLLNDLFDSS